MDICHVLRAVMILYLKNMSGFVLGLSLGIVLAVWGRHTMQVQVHDYKAV